jgi:hypothetical protein
MKPIQYRSEHYKAEKCLAELLVPSADSAAALDTAKKVFDDVAVAIEQFGEVMLNPTRNTGRNAGSRSTSDDFLTKVLRVESTICDNPAIGEFVQQRIDRSEIVTVSGYQMQTDRSTQAIHDGGQLGIHPALGLPNCLSGSTTGSVRCVLMDLDVRAIDAAQRAARVSGEQGEHLRPTLTFAPTAEPGVHGGPGAKLLRQVTPWLSSTQNKVHSTHHDPVVLRRPSANSTSGDTSSAGFIRSIFLSAPRADRAKPNDLI